MLHEEMTLSEFASPIQDLHVVGFSAVTANKVALVLMYALNNSFIAACGRAKCVVN